MNFRATFAATSFVAFLLGACSSTTVTNPNGVSSADVSRCKSSCDKMKFFDCASADAQAKCYGDCDSATLNQIQIFTGCAENSICDPACRTTIQPKPSGGGGGTSSGGGASAGSCGTACDKLVSCSLIRVGDKSACVSQCQSTAYQYQIDCVNNHDCDKIKSVCGDPAGSGGTVDDAGSGGSDAFKIMMCQQACDSLNFFSCITAGELSTCRTKCSTAPATTRDSFSSCGNNAGGDCTKGKDCYSTFTQ